MKTLKYIITIALIQLSFGSSSQQLSSYSMFHLDRYQNSPSAAGTKPYVFVSCSYSRYWSGFEGAPSMQILDGHSLVSQRVALGGKIFNEDTGLSGKSGVELSYAYHLPVGSSGTKASLGLSAHLLQYRLYKDKFIVHDHDDEVINLSSNNTIAPDFSCGLSLYQDNKFFIDLGVFRLLNRKVSFFNDAYLQNRQVRHYFLSLGYKFNFSEDFSLEPSALLKITEKAFYQIDAGFKAEYKKRFGTGIYYRLNDGIVIYAGFSARKIAVGYSYGLVLSGITPHTGGSHELTVILKIDNAKTNLEKAE